MQWRLSRGCRYSDDEGVIERAESLSIGFPRKNMRDTQMFGVIVHGDAASGPNRCRCVTAYRSARIRAAKRSRLVLA